MARNLVTRTILTTRATVLCMDIANREPFNTEVVLPRTYKDEAKLLKACKNAIDNDTVKCVAVVKVETVETLYGMDEAKFIANSEVLPPRKGAKNADEMEG